MAEKRGPGLSAAGAGRLLYGYSRSGQTRSEYCRQREFPFPLSTITVRQSQQRDQELIPVTVVASTPGSVGDGPQCPENFGILLKVNAICVEREADHESARDRFALVVSICPHRCGNLRSAALHGSGAVQSVSILAAPTLPALLLMPAAMSTSPDRRVRRPCP